MLNMLGSWRRPKLTLGCVSLAITVAINEHLLRWPAVNTHRQRRLSFKRLSSYKKAIPIINPSVHVQATHIEPLQFNPLQRQCVLDKHRFSRPSVHVLSCRMAQRALKKKKHIYRLNWEAFEAPKIIAHAITCQPSPSVKQRQDTILSTRLSSRPYAIRALPLYRKAVSAQAYDLPHRRRFFEALYEKATAAQWPLPQQLVLGQVYNFTGASFFETMQLDNRGLLWCTPKTKPVPPQASSDTLLRPTWLVTGTHHPTGQSLWAVVEG